MKFRVFTIFILLAALLFPAKNDDDIISMMEFYNADIKAVVDYVSDVTGYTIIIDPSVRGKVSISAKDKITVKESLDIIDSLLKAIGYTFEREGKIFKIVRLKDLSIVKDLYTSIDEVKNLEKNKIITYIRTLKYAKGETVIKNIKQFQSQFGHILYDSTTQKLIITDFRDNITHLDKLISQFDITEAESESALETIELKNMSIDQAVKFINSSIDDVEVEDTRYPASKKISTRRTRTAQKLLPKVQIISLDRSDKFIISGDKGKVREIKKLVEELDEKFESSLEINYEVIKLDNFTSKEIIDILNRIIYGESTSSSSRRTTAAAKSSKPSIRLKGKVDFLTLTKDDFLIIIGEDQDRDKVKNVIQDLENAFDKEDITPSSRVIRIVPIQYLKAVDILALLDKLKDRNKSSNSDELIDNDVKLIGNDTLNSIIISANQKKISDIEDLIKQLDKRLTQVLVEVKLIEVTYRNDLDVDLSFHNLGTQILTKKGIKTYRGLLSSSEGTGENINFNRVLKFGSPLNAGSDIILRMLQTISEVNIISTPNLLTLDNKKAKIKISEKRAIESQKVQVAATPTSGPQELTTREYKDAGISLEITPHISDSSNLTLEVNLEVNDFKQTASLPGFPDITSRTINTEIIVGHRTTAILGGLIEKKKEKTLVGVPGLMSIPILGWLFRKTTIDNKNTELMLLITPYILDSDTDLKELSNEKVNNSLFNNRPSRFKNQRRKKSLLNRESRDKKAE